MRKYKEIGKRIIGLILTVCMITGLLPAVPAKAATSLLTGTTLDLYVDSDCVTTPVASSSYTYTGSMITPYTKVVCGGIALKRGTDYTVNYKDNIDAGTATVEVTGLGSYDGTITTTFNINKVSFSRIDVVCAMYDDHGVYCYYDVNGSKPAITSVTGVTTTSKTWILTPNDYDVTYARNSNICIDADDANVPYFTITLNPDGNYKTSSSLSSTNSINITYRIFYNMANVTVSGIGNLTYTGLAQTPSFTVVNSLVSGAATTYTSKWTSNTDAGTATLTLYGTGAYLGEYSKTYTIGQAHISSAMVELDRETYDYTGSEIKMDDHVTVKLNGVTISPLDYYITYYEGYSGSVGNNVMYINGRRNLNGQQTVTFQIVNSIKTVTLDSSEYPYTGLAIAPSLTVKDAFGNTLASTRYKVSYYTDADYLSEITGPTAVGTYYIKITGNTDNFFKGTLGTPEEPIAFRIVPKTFDTAKFYFGTTQVYNTSSFSVYYSGSNNTISLKITDNGVDLTSSDYSVKYYSDAACTNEVTTIKDVGTYYIKITGKGSYERAEYVLTYTVAVTSVSNLSFTVTPQTYTGSAIIPSKDAITVTCRFNSSDITLSGDDYDVSCTNNTNVGTADITIKLKGNYTGTATGTFQIKARKLSDCTVSSTVTFLVYNGAEQKSSITIKDSTTTLIEGTHYEVRYYTNSNYNSSSEVTGMTNCRTYYIKASGIGIYASSETGADITWSCTVTQRSLTATGITFTAANSDYTGSAVTPVLTVADGSTTLTPTTDYTVVNYYSDEACTTTATPVSGKYYVKIQGANNYQDTKVASFYVGKDFSLLTPKLELSGSALVYNTQSQYDALINKLVVRDSAGEVIDSGKYKLRFYATAAHTTEITNTGNELFKNAGTIYVGIEGANGYYGTVDDTVSISPRSISNMDAAVLGTYTYTGSAIAVVINDDPDTKTTGIVLKFPDIEAIDYVLGTSDYSIVTSSYTNNLNAGTASVTLTGQKNFTGTKTVNFIINQKSLNDLANLKITVSSATYTSRKQTPSVTVTYGDSNTSLTTDDFSVEYFKDSSFSVSATDADLTNAGSVYLKITGKINYKDTAIASKYSGSNVFTINPRNISETVVSIDGLSYVYSAITNTSKIPTFTVRYAYLADTYFTLPTTDFTYSPTEVGYTIGRQSLDIEGKGNFTGTKTISYYNLGNMNNAADEIYIEGVNESYAYTAATATNGITCSNLVVYNKTTGQKIDSSCYTVSYKSNTTPGTATITISGNSTMYWTGTYTKTFKITDTIADAEITVPVQTYLGKNYTADDLKNMQVTCHGYTLRYGIDYEVVSITNGKEAALSTATNAPTVVIQGIGDYFTGTATKSAKFSIKYDITSSDVVVGDISNQLYTGKAVKPTISVRYFKSDSTYANLAENTDYTVEYFNNTAVAAANGTKGPYAVITSTGAGDLTAGTITVPFSIGMVDLEAEGYYIDGVQAEYMYTGAVIKPTFTVKDKDGNILEATNYNVYYSPANAVEAGSAVTVTVTGKTNYYGSVTASFNIVKRTLDDVTITIADQTYTGKEIKPTFRVQFTDYAGKIQYFTENVDYYIVGYYKNVDAAEAGLSAYNYTDGPYIQIKAVAGRSLTGERNIPFTILPKDMENLVYSTVSDMTYEPGKTEYKPAVTVKLAKDSTDYLVEGKDYRLIYHNYTMVADANGTNGPYIEIIPYDDNENLTGTKIISYSVKKKSMQSADIQVVLSDANEANQFDPVHKNYPNVGTYYPTVRIFDYADAENPVELVSGTDFSLSYTGNSAVGTATITITGLLNYKDSIKEYFSIGTLFDADHISITQNNSPLLDDQFASATYNGTKQLPEGISVKVITPARELTAGTGNDYVIEYFLDAACTRGVTENDVCNAGTYYVRIRGLTSAGFIGNIVIPYKIKQKSVNAASVKVADIPDQFFGDGKIRPSIVITDEETGERLPTTQYDVSYEDNTTIGGAYAIITANETGNYTGSRRVGFYILRQDINAATVYSIADQEYTGSEITPSPQVYFDGTLLVENKDYRLTYGNNTDAGKAWIVLQGIGNYTNVTTEIGFKIKANLEKAIVSSIVNQVYTGKQVKPKPTSVVCGGNKLKEGVDYIVDYEPNIIVGDGAVILLPNSEYYTGSKVIKFYICRDIDSASVEIPSSQVYTASAITPEPVVKVGATTLKKDVHYTVRWTNDVNVGTAAVTVTGIGDYAGSKTTSYNIIAKSIARCSVSSVSDKVYTKNAQTPAVVVKDGNKVLAQNIDYTISYSSNQDIGTATITVTGIGNYSGKADEKFSIISAPTTGLKASAQTKTSAKLSWNKGSNVTGYQIYTNDSKTLLAQPTSNSATLKKLKAGTTYKYKVRSYTKIGSKTYYGDFTTINFATKPDTPKVTVKSSKTKTTVVSWKQVTGSNGYEIYYSTSKNGKYQLSATIIKNNVLSYTHTGLTKGKTYYYKVRAYRTIGGNKVYSAYSNPKKVKVK